MEKRWVLRLPGDLDSWLTLKAAEETVKRGRRFSKNALLIEIATKARDSQVGRVSGQPEATGGWHDVKRALAYIQEAIEERTKLSSAMSDRWKQRVSVNLKMVASYLEEMDEW